MAGVGNRTCQIEYGLALHVGDVMYGNIGSNTRLDFTVIGPSVNLTARIESMCRPLGRSLLLSSDFVTIGACRQVARTSSAQGRGSQSGDLRASGRADLRAQVKRQGPDVSQALGRSPLFFLFAPCLSRFRCCRGLGVGVLFGLPGLELFEQRFLVGFGRHLSGHRALLEEIVKPAAADRLDPVRIEPLLGIWQALPASQRGRERNLFPLRVEGRVLELREFREEGVHEIA